MPQKYTVTAKDNPLHLAQRFKTTTAKLLGMNGIKSLTVGQTIRVPQPPLHPQDNVLQPSSYNRPQASSAWNAIGQIAFSPLEAAGFKNPFRPAPINPYANLHPGPFPLHPQDGSQAAAIPNPTGNIFRPTMPPPNVLTGTIGGDNGGGIYNMNAQQNAQNMPNNNGLPAGYTNYGTVARPIEPFTAGGANSVSWLSYWDDQARNPPVNTAPQFPGFSTGGGQGGYHTLREARQAQRRRQDAGADYVPRSVITPPPPTGNAVNTSLSWRIG